MTRADHSTRVRLGGDEEGAAFGAAYREVADAARAEGFGVSSSLISRNAQRPGGVIASQHVMFECVPYYTSRYGNADDSH